jgi:hypothetical protein
MFGCQEKTIILSKERVYQGFFKNVNKTAHLHEICYKLDKTAAEIYHLLKVPICDRA